jgi:hypothetical protein
VATKLKITYVKNNFLDVRPVVFLCEPLFLISNRSKSNTKLVRTCSSRKRNLTLILYFLGDDWSDCMHLKNVALPDAPYLGFSAMTGDVSDAHEYVTFPSLFK